MSDETSGPMEIPGKPGRTKKPPTGETRKPLTLTEKIKNVCIGLGALSALILGLVATCKGEPVAQKTWDTLRLEVNKQADAIKRLHARIVYLQAHEEGRTSASLQLKLEELQKKLDEMKARAPTASAPVTPTAVAKLPCRPGFIEADGRCQQAPKAVIKRVEKEAAAAVAVKQKLLEEKRRSSELEQRLIRKAKQVQADMPDLRPLPKKLDDAAKEEGTTK